MSGRHDPTGLHTPPEHVRAHNKRYILDWTIVTILSASILSCVTRWSRIPRIVWGRYRRTRSPAKHRRRGAVVVPGKSALVSTGLVLGARPVPFGTLENRRFLLANRLFHSNLTNPTNPPDPDASENEKPRVIAGLSSGSTDSRDPTLESLSTNAPVDFSLPFEENRLA